MARYRIAKDEHRFLTQGYPVLDEKGQDDVRFCTYQVNAGGERVFELAGFEDGDRVPEEVFYALLLDRDLFNQTRPNGIEAGAIPNRVLAAMDAEVKTSGLGGLDLAGAKCLFDVFEVFVRSARNPHFALSLASWLWIAHRRKKHDAATQRSRR